MKILTDLFSNALAVTIFVILVTSLIGFYVKMRSRDRCLRDLDGYQVTIETKDDHVAWGTLRTYATGVELLYISADPSQETPPLVPPRPTEASDAHGGEAEKTAPVGAVSPSPAGVGAASSSTAGTESASSSPRGLWADRGRQGERAGGQATDLYTKHSFILYNNELPRIECFYRFHDHQSDERRRRRERDIKKTYQPSLPRRIVRTVRNTLTTFRDAIVQSLNAVLGARAAASPQTLVLTQHKDLTASGAQLMESAVGSAYDPILEHYVGQYVVLEMQSQGQIIEEHGILKEYSSQYIELLNARVEVPLDIYFRRRPRYAERQVHVKQEGQVVRMWHNLAHPIVVQTLRAGDAERELDVPLDPGQQIEIPLSEAETAGPIAFAWGVRCLADLVVPRTSAVVRHAGKREALSWDAWLGLDDLELPWLKRLVRARREEQLRVRADQQGTHTRKEDPQ